MRRFSIHSGGCWHIHREIQETPGSGRCPLHSENQHRLQINEDNDDNSNYGCSSDNIYMYSSNNYLLDTPIITMAIKN